MNKIEYIAKFLFNSLITNSIDYHFEQIEGTYQLLASSLSLWQSDSRFLTYHASVAYDTSNQRHYERSEVNSALSGRLPHNATFQATHYCL